MGGTYWYYYKLDDDIEFYNSAEPTTTQCPLLPGQLVNVLQVPYALSGNRSRNASVSSTNSELRTMEPADKYMNPRPVPRPKLYRLQTSPMATTTPLASTSTSAIVRPALSAGLGKSSGPSSASTLRMPVLSRKTSLDSHSRGLSPSIALAGGLKTALRSFTTPRSTSPGSAHDRSARKIEVESDVPAPANLKIITPQSASASRGQSPSGSRGRSNDGEHDLAFRRKPQLGPEGTVDAVTSASFAEHRRQRSRSRETSSLRNSLVLEDTTAPVNDVADRKRQLSTVKEVASAQPTPAMPAGGPRTADLERAAAALDLEKRLPTLPNTPSSAYPRSVTEINPSPSASVDQLASHFSSTTIDTSSSVPSSATNSDRFSNFSAAYTDTTHSSDITDNILDSEPMSEESRTDLHTPKTARTDAGTVIEDTPQPSARLRVPESNLPATLSSSTISSTTASSLSTSPSDYLRDAYNWPTRSTSRGSPPYQHYRLPSEEYASEVTLKPTRNLTSREGELPEMPDVFRPPTSKYNQTKGPQKEDVKQLHPQGPGFPHSNSMQQLLDELSYLGNMIHRG